MSYDISLFVPGLPLEPDILEKKSVGGSETAGLQMAEALTRAGNRVTLFCTVKAPVMHKGVLYLPFGDYPGYLATYPHDVAIVQRTPEAFVDRTNARLNILWQHDLAIGRTANAFRGVLWNVDKVFVLSDFHLKQYQEVYDNADELYYLTRNGIDLAHYKPKRPSRRDDLLVYASRPERGLDVLLRDIMPKVWEQRPDVKLALCTYDHKHPSMQGFYSRIDSYIRQLNVPEGRIQFAGHLTKRQLADLYETATALVYPTPSPEFSSFREISCITAMEAQACGLPIIASDAGALRETIHPGAGVLVPMGDNNGFVSAITDLLGDKKRRTEMGDVGFSHAQTDLSWDAVAEDWTARFGEWIAERNNEPERLARHMIALSDIIPAKEVVRRMPDGPAKADLSAILDGGQWDFVDKGNYKDQYDKIVHDLKVHDNVLNETRLRWLVNELAQRPHVKKILDVGVAHGSYPIHANNLLTEQGAGPRHWVGTDISAHSIDCARKLLEDGKSKVPESHLFLVGDETLDLAAATTQEGSSFQPAYDGLIVFEVLEHVPEPWKFLANLERWLKPDSEVFITVPVGPWEQMSYRTYPHRCHIWHYDLHDIRDMLGHKPDFTVAFTPFSQSPENGQTLGWWFIRYRKGYAAPKPIDLERHIKLQRPAETVSAVMMIGPGAEECLHWSLRSAQQVADEIVLVDNGASEEALRIAAQYRPRIVPGVDPKAEGFETPRNIGVNAARMDWVFWIDSDEKLCDAKNVYRYLRKNHFDGYGVRQHHFACDTNFNPDMPVRFFRNNGRRTDGKTIRFWGMIHEHPETAINEGPGRTTVLSDMHVAHVGYLTETVRRQRFQRNNPLLARDREKYPDRILGHHFEIRDKMLWVNFILEQSGGQPNEQVFQLCREVRDLYQQHFKGQAYALAHDTLMYYSSALKILGEGFEFTWSSAAAKDDPTPNGQKKARFADLDDLMATLKADAEAKAGPLLGRYY